MSLNSKCRYSDRIRNLYVFSMVQKPDIYILEYVVRVKKMEGY